MNNLKQKILLVDDDTNLLELLSIRLIAAGYETTIAKSAEEAINYLDLTRPQLVISDVQMSGMDGMALFEHIHRIIPTLPVIILTATLCGSPTQVVNFMLPPISCILANNL